MTRPIEKIDFVGSTGATLSGRLHRPVSSPRATALFAHCFTCSKDIRAARLITEALAAAGIATLRFDFTGLGDSDGNFADTHFSSNVADLVAASDWLARHLDAPSLLVGHSLGGSAVLVAASQIASCVAVATIGAPSDPAHVAHLFDGSADAINEHGEATVALAGRPFCIKQELLDDLRRQTLVQRLPDLKPAVLLLHSPQDATVGIEHAQALYAAARHPKSFGSLDGADHLLTKARDAAYAGSLIAAWASRYLPEVANAPLKPKHRDDIEVRTGNVGFMTNIVAHGIHHLVADEPESVGGTDTGPTPFDLLCAALGACSTMTLRMYADRKKWPLQEAVAHISHRKVKVAADESPTGKASTVDHFDRELQLSGPLSDEQKTRLLEIADKCPVHKTLHGEVEVHTSLKP